MNHDPYTPPSSAVADPQAAQAFPPARVYLAAVLILASLVLGLVTLVPGVRVPAAGEPPMPPWFTLAIIVVFGGITVWLAIELLRRRNWARWSMLVYLALGWILSAQEIADSFTRSPFSSGIDALCIVIEAAACWLLLTGDSARWFGRRD